MSDREIRELERDVERGVRTERELALARFRHDGTETFYDLLYQAKRKGSKVHLVRVPLEALVYVSASPREDQETVIWRNAIRYRQPRLGETVGEGIVRGACKSLYEVPLDRVRWGRFAGWCGCRHCLDRFSGTTLVQNMNAIIWGERAGISHPRTLDPQRMVEIRRRVHMAAAEVGLWIDTNPLVTAIVGNPPREESA